MCISVVTAVFDRKSTIVQAIESVQAQTHPDLEHVRQDGGSPDGTPHVVREKARGDTWIESKWDSGVYDAINRAIARATGDLMELMHSDDFYAHDSVLEKVAAVFADPQIDGVYDDLAYVSVSDPNRVMRHWESGTYDRANLGRGWMPPHPTLYLRRHVFDTWGAHNTQFQISADYGAVLRWLATGGIRLAGIPGVLVKMRIGGEGAIALSAGSSARAARIRERRAATGCAASAPWH